MINTIILIYEEIPERTIIAHLQSNDLDQALITLDDLHAIAGKVENSDDLSEVEAKTFNDVYDALRKGGAWHKYIVNHRQPYEISGPCTIIWCGSVM